MINKAEIDIIIDDIRLEIERNNSVFTDASIEYGKMGAALYYFYCQKYYNNQSFVKRGELLIEESITILSETSKKNEYIPKYKGDSVSQSLSSFGKGLLFIQNRFELEYDFSEYYSMLNELLYESTRQAINRTDYDYFSGCLSSGFYFLNQYYYNKDQHSIQILKEIVDSILNSAIYHNKEEIYWRSPTYSNQVYLGLSHGSAMIINFLTKIFLFKIHKEKSEEIESVVRKSIRFLMSRKRNLINGYFPYKFPAIEPVVETQFSMCYGDLGILLGIYNATRAFDLIEFFEEVNTMLHTCSSRKINKNQTQDASILYGAAGLSQIFKDLFEASGDSIFDNASHYWYEQILQYRNKEKLKLAGFIFDYEEDKKIHPSAKYSFFWGIGGIGITLMLRNDESLPNLNEITLIGIKN